MTVEDELLNAAARYRAIVHNREHGMTAEEQRLIDDRVMTAEVDLEAALLATHVMSVADAVASISVVGPDRVVHIVFDDGRVHDIKI